MIQGTVQGLMNGNPDPAQSWSATVFVGQEPGVKIEEQSLDAIPTSPTFTPFSVNIYEFPVRQ